MKTPLLFMCMIVLSNAFAAKDWEKELTMDLVEIKSEKMNLDEYNLYTSKNSAGEESKLQIKLHAEAPVQIISRDNFVCFTTVVLTETLADIANGDDFDIDDLDAVIGKPDLELNIYMTKEGFQVEVINTSTNTSEKSTEKWENIFASE